MSHLKAILLSRGHETVTQQTVPPQGLAQVPNQGDLELKPFANLWPPSPSSMNHVTSHLSYTFLAPGGYVRAETNP